MIDQCSPLFYRVYVEHYLLGTSIPRNPHRLAFGLPVFIPRLSEYIFSKLKTRLCYRAPMRQLLA